MDIYGMWHPFDEGKDMTAEVRSKAEAISTNITDCDEQSLFSVPLKQEFSGCFTDAQKRGDDRIFI